MAINIFEGSRRITQLAAALWLVGFAAGAISSHWYEGVLWAVGGSVFIFGFSAAVGWIMRGFLGIPLGKDRKEEKG